MKVLVTGAGGLVGRAVIEHCNSAGDEVLPYDHRSLDIGNASRVFETLQNEKAEVVINCAAWTNVDGCELDPAHAYAANADGPENLANACRQVDAGLITISTDYVFDGRKEGFYTQRDKPNPESVYGKAKLDGERRAQSAWARTIVVRSGFIFGPGGKNFLSTVVDRSRRGEPLSVINDSYGTPTYSHDLAARLRELAELDQPGVFHVVNEGPGVSYEEFARAALSAAGCEVNLRTVRTEDLKRPALRPRNSRLKCVLSAALGLKPLPNWHDSLIKFVGLSTPLKATFRP